MVIQLWSLMESGTKMEVLQVTHLSDSTLNWYDKLKREKCTKKIKNRKNEQYKCITADTACSPNVGHAISRCKCTIGQPTYQ